jgi:hypothetical protein
MDVGIAARATIMAAAAVLAFALVAFGASSAPLHRAHGHRAAHGTRAGHGLRLRVDSANVMPYLAAAMALALGWAVAFTG